MHSCHVVFGRVSSEYFEHNPSAAANMPGIAKTIRAITPEECAQVLVDVIDHPRRELAYPFMLRMYGWTHAVAPGLVRGLLRWTGARRGAP